MKYSKNIKKTKNTFRSLLIAVFAVISLSIVFGYYYYEDFSAGATGWTLGFRYGRGGVLHRPDDMTNYVTGGNLVFRGNVNNDDLDYIGTWLGRMAFYNSTSFVASATNPFGVEFRRTYSRIDPHADIYGNDNAESHRHIAAMSFWLVQDPSNMDDSVENTFFPNAIIMYDMMRMGFNTNSGQPRSTWGYYIGSEQRFDLTSAQRPDGTTVDITSDATYTLEWNYDEKWGVGTEENAGDGDFGAGTWNANANNNNEIIVRITHDGSTVRFYINPDPDDGNLYPNEFLLVGSADVSWNDNLKFMVGMESKRYDCEKQDADIDHVLVRSSADTLTSEIYPSQIAQGTTNTFQLVVTPTFTADDAGIGQLTIRKPAGYTTIPWNISDIQVFTDNGSGTNLVAISGPQLMTYTAGVPTLKEQVYITTNTNGRDLHLRFFQDDTLANAGVINSQTGSTADDKKIVVVFKMATPVTANASGYDFEVFANCIKYNTQSYPRWATTGEMKSVAGNAQGGIFTSDDLKVKTYNSPDSLATISPEIIYIGNNRTVYLYVATTNDNAAGISEMRIKVPDGYTVNYADPTRFSSLYIVNDDSYVFATNVAGTDYIYVQYENDGGLLPSPGGLDRITIQVDSTPTNFSGPQTNTEWTAQVFSSIAGTSGTSCRTNSTYPNRNVIVRQLPPDAGATLATSVVQNSTNYIYNHVKYNQVSYVINNNGGTGNNLKKVRLFFPSMITNVNTIHSALMPDISELANIAYYASNNSVIIDYEGAGISIAGGASDTITFWMSDNLTPMFGVTNGSITAEADNGNGDLYQNVIEGGSSWDITWRNPPASGKASVQVINSITSGNTNKIYTSDTTTQIKVSINNDGGTYNNVQYVEITVPAQFTNISAVSSIVMQDDAANISVAGNTIYLRYYNDTSSYIGNMASDTITFTGIDNVPLSTQSTVTLVVKVGNTTSSADLMDTSNLGEGNKWINFILPPVQASGYVTPNLIDSSTVTNTLTYYVNNTAVTENYIGELRLYVPDSIASNMIDVTSTHLSGFPGNVTVVTSGFSNYIRVLYSGASLLYGGSSDTITFKMIDHISGYSNFQVVAEASNVQNSWTSLLVTGGQTNNVSIQIPPASANVSVSPNIIFASPSTMVTNLLVISISNSGASGNDITNVIINHPSIFQPPNQIIMATNLAANSGIVYAGFGTPFRIFYTNKLAAGQTDTLFVYFRNNFSTLQNDLAFTATVDNGEGPQSASAPSGGSLNVSVVEQPTVQLAQADSSPNEIYTTDTMSSFSFIIKNGQTGGKGIKKLLIELPFPFVTEDIVINSPWPGTTEQIVTNGSTKIEIDYSINDLDAGYEDTISLTLKDVLVIGTTNVSFTAHVDYGDGYGSRDTVVASSKSINMAFVFPDASAKGYMLPQTVNMNDTATVFTLTITNDGVPGNHIRLAEIDLGSRFTNVTGATSSLIGGSVVVSSNVLFLDYDTNGTNMQSQGSDTITFTAYDDVTQITNTTVGIRVSNSTNTNYYRAATALSTDSLKVSFYRPDYIASAYIVPQTPVSPARPNSIYSTVTTSTLQFVVINNGAPGNNLDMLRLYIPDTYFDSASFTILSSSKVPNSLVQRAGNIITVYYTNTNYQLLATESDTITFSISDVVSDSNAAAIWTSTSRFITSGVEFLTNQLVSGQSNAIVLDMPSPSGKARLLQQEVYTTSGKVVIALDITNTGTGSNDLKQVQITVPAGLQTALGVGSLTNSFATNVSYAAGVFTLNYTNFTINKNDRIFLIMTNTYTTTTEASFSLQLANNTLSAAAGEWTANALKIRAVTPPSVYCEIPSPKDGVYNRLYSTDFSDQYKVYIRNDGTGTSGIKKATVNFPAGFVLSGASADNCTNIQIAANVITLDYSADPLTTSVVDELTVTVEAPFHSGSSNISISVAVGEVDTLQINTNYTTTRIFSGKSLQVSYAHPVVNGEFYIDGYADGTKPSVIVAPRNGIAVTNLKIRVENVEPSTSSNKIYQVQVTAPQLFSQLSNAVSTVSGAGVVINSNTMTITYAGNKLESGAFDVISFDAYYVQYDATNNLTFSVNADNNNGSGLSAASVKASKFNTIDMKYPPIAVFAGSKNVASLYTIFTNSTIEYQIKNRAQGYSITSLIITNFDFSKFTNVSFTVSGKTPSLSTNGSTIRLDYGAGNEIAFNEIDTLKINVIYQITNNNITTLTLESICYLTNETLGSSTNTIVAAMEAIDTDTGSADNQHITIGPAPFSQLRGTILPVFKTDKQNPGSFLPNLVKVEVIEAASSTVISTPYNKEVGADGSLVNKPLQTYTDPSAGGNFSIDYVPGGAYRIRLTSDGFRTTITNFTSLSNVIVTLPTMSLKNATLDSDGVNNQMVVDYNDTNTRFILPSGKLLDQFSLDISVVDMTTPQETDVKQSKVIKNINATSTLGCFYFSIKNNLAVEESGIGLGGDSTLVLHYTTSNLNLPLGSEWEEANLSIYYWKDSTEEWIPVGGIVDAAANTISARINFLHNYYAVASIKPDAAANAIYNVKASPNPFTPGRGSEQSAKVKITFSFNQSYDKYTIAIFNMRGQQVKYFERDGTYKQGEVFWDGNHENGFGLPGGVYLYQIKAGDQVFTGTILLLK